MKAVAQAEAALDQATLRAPFDGAVTVLEVSPGQAVMPGQPVLTLTKIHHLQAVTIDLSERDSPGVGGPASDRVRGGAGRGD
jgi:multidrug efflux pump subunit AcrA (membrane-fusion protein)